MGPDSHCSSLTQWAEHRSGRIRCHEVCPGCQIGPEPASRVTLEGGNQKLPLANFKPRAERRIAGLVHSADGLDRPAPSNTLETRALELAVAEVAGTFRGAAPEAKY
jgi:hypothetical protein